MPVKVLYEIVVKDKYGKVKNKILGESKTFVKNFLKAIRIMFLSDVNYYEQMPNVSGVDANFYGGFSGSGTYAYGAFPMIAKIPSNNDTRGIVVGSGSTPFNPSQYALASKISHGTSAGQLLYGDQAIDEPIIVGNEVDFQIYRTFTNNSGDVVTIREIGLYITNRIFSYGSQIDSVFMIIRDVLSTPITLNNGESVVIRYVLKTS